MNIRATCWRSGCDRRYHPKLCQFSQSSFWDHALPTAGLKGAVPRRQPAITAARIPGWELRKGLLECRYWITRFEFAQVWVASDRNNTNKIYYIKIRFKNNRSGKGWNPLNNKIARNGTCDLVRLILITGQWVRLPEHRRISGMPKRTCCYCIVSTGKAASNSEEQYEISWLIQLQGLLIAFA